MADLKVRKGRQLAITPAVGGYMVTIGCVTGVCTTASELGDFIAEYYDDPDGVEKRYAKVNAGVCDGGEDAVEPTPTTGGGYMAPTHEDRREAGRPGTLIRRRE